jgi:hypothetical protein
MSVDIEQTLVQVARETFAIMAFMLPPEDDEAVAEDESARATAAVTFSGPFGGTLCLTVSGYMLSNLADSILGIEGVGPQSSPEEQQDALKEVLNVICGNLLPQIATPQEVFHVHTPYFVPDAEVEKLALEGIPKAEVTLRMDCGKVDLLLSVDSTVEMSA